MAYALTNAIFHWEDGERRLREASDLERADLELAVAAVQGELRRRLGSSFTVDELAALYASGVDWATAVAGTHAAGTDAPWVVDAAFHRYAPEAVDYAGGRPRGP